jgi:ribonuclease D
MVETIDPNSETWLDETPPEILSRLRQWRYEQAKSEGVPAWIVLSNALLHELARTRPDTDEALGAVRGMGPTRRQKYGDTLLRLFRGAEEAAPQPPPKPRMQLSADAPTPFVVSIDYIISDAMRRTLVDELARCGGTVAPALRRVLRASSARVILRVESPAQDAA